MEPPPKILPPALPLIRTFRSDSRAIPSFLQDLLMDWTSRAPCEHLSRINELIKHIQYCVCLNSFDQGKIWYTVRSILQKGLLDDDMFFRDGRQLRSLLLNDIHKKVNPYSPIHNNISAMRRKQELNIMSPRPVKI